MAARMAGSSRVSATRSIAAVSRYGSLALAGLIIAVIALLILPLPTALLDVLIATNLAVSIALLMLSVYIPSALGLSTFPALLLLTTLFRLSLNIASTKLILLNADAGHIIDTFGHMVVSGNVVVGIVVFLIIAIVQFIVIAKGAERVAEVGARFSLDGMPGKQMAIDADLRAGLIGKDEANRRRREIEEESQLHGAMDGAMKFVKGDAIAGLIIAFVNIVAGVAIGVSMHDLSLGDAVSTYSVLSIGDGMVAQIPSLFVSIAAGIVITRVDGAAQHRTHLGAQIARQVLGYPNALLMAAGIVATFLFVPGLPVWPFVMLALALAGASQLARHGWRAPDMAQPREILLMSASGSTEDTGMSPVAMPLRLRIAADLATRLEPRAFDAAIDKERDRLAEELGLVFPALRVAVDARLPAAHYAIDVQEVLVSLTTARDESEAEQPHSLSESSHESLTDSRSHGPVLSESPHEPMTGNHSRAAALSEPSHEPVTGSRSRVPGRNASLALAERLAVDLARTVRAHADSFVGMQEVHALLMRAAAQLPDLTAEVQRAVPLQKITDVMRRLAQEGVSLRHLREICESLIAWAAREKDIVMLTEYVRVDLGRFIASRYLDAKGQLRAVVLDGEAERTIRAAIHQSAGGSFVSLDPDAAQSLIDSASHVLQPSRPEGPAILLTSMDVRRYLKKLLDARFPNLVVLSFEELPAHVNVQSLGRLSLHHPALRLA
jgi:type III secretion protein V